MVQDKNLTWQLFCVFARIGAFTFGGGWAMISIIEREIVINRKWLSREDFFDLLAVTQALPGVLAVNIAATLGDRLGGRRGAVAAAMGAIMPSFCIILAIAIFLTPEIIESNHVASSVFKGIRPAVVALIIAPVITTAKSIGIGWKTVWIPVVVAVLIWSKLPWISNPILFILIGGIAGYVLMMRREKKSLRQIEKDGKEEGL